jgi:U3 small nucleolar RNA-associated protein 20
MFELDFNKHKHSNTGTISKMLSDNTLIELNAFEENTLSNEYDFERRSKVFKSINKEETFKTMDPTLLEAVLRHYTWCLRDPEMLIRRFSASGLSKMLRHFAECKDETMIRVYVRNVVFSGLRVWIQDYKTTEVIRRELFVLLTEAISLFANLSDHPGLHGDLACLCRPNDIEADFWRNLLHTQMHRRIRALRRMATSIRT